MANQPIIVQGCCPAPAPDPEVIDVLNCDLTTTAETFDAPLSRVVIVQDKPFVICATPQIDVEHRTICNLDTDTWHYVTTVYIDGVLDNESSVDSNIPCSEPLPFPPDVEQLDRCDLTTKTIHTDVIRYVTDSVTNVTTSTVLSSVDTGIACNQEEIDKIVTTWLPVCIDGVQWYVAEQILFNNSTQTETVANIYKQGANGAIVTAAPTGTIVDGYCTPPKVETVVDLECNGDTGFYDQIVSVITDGVVAAPVRTQTTISCELDKDIEQRTYCNLTTGTLWNVVSSFDSDGVETVVSNTNLGIDCTPTVVTQDFELVCNSTTKVYDLYAWTITDGVASAPVITATTTPCDSDKPDFEYTEYCNAPTNTIFRQLVSITDGVSTNIGAAVDTLKPCGKVESISEVEICADGVAAVRKTIIDSTGVETVSFYATDGAAITPTTYTIGACPIDSTPAQRIHENFVVTGTTPLVIPAGLISISVTKTNNTGIVNVSGDNAASFPLTFNRENFTDSVNEGYSTLSAYTITGTAAGTTYKVHIIR